MRLSDRLRVTLSALPALVVPLVVMIGIYGGFVTVTEAAALSAVVALGVSLAFYRGFHWTQTLSVIADGLRSAATIMLIIATALAVGHWLTAVRGSRALCRISVDPSVRDLAVLTGNQVSCCWSSAASWK